MFSLLRSYWAMIGILVLLALASNVLSLFLPKVVSAAINAFVGGKFVYTKVVTDFSLLAVGIFLLTVVQNIVQVYTSEKVAKNLRSELSNKISKGSFLFIQNVNPSKLLTHLTSDVDSVKMFVAQAVTSLISSVVIIVGASIMLLTINWRLGLAVMTIILLLL